MDKYCIFFYSIKSPGKYSFSVGSNKTVSLSFNKFGNSLNLESKRKPYACQNKSNVFQLHTKSSDYIEQQKRDEPISHSTYIILKPDENNSTQSQNNFPIDNRYQRLKSIRSKGGNKTKNLMLNRELLKSKVSYNLNLLSSLAKDGHINHDKKKPIHRSLKRNKIKKRKIIKTVNRYSINNSNKFKISKKSIPRKRNF